MTALIWSPFKYIKPRHCQINLNFVTKVKLKSCENTQIDISTHNFNISSLPKDCPCHTNCSNGCACPEIDVLGNSYCPRPPTADKDCLEQYGDISAECRDVCTNTAYYCSVACKGDQEKFAISTAILGKIMVKPISHS